MTTMRTAILAVLIGVTIMMLLVLYHLDVFITRQSAQHYNEAEFGGGQVEQATELDKVRRNGLTHNLTAVNLDKMTREQVFLTLHSYLDNIDVVCRRKLRMGHLDDGGWEVCDDPDVRPTSPCTVYSYGINNDYTFDDDISKLYGCHVYCFDPTVAADTHNRSSHVHFYKLGIAGERTLTAENWHLYRHEEIRSLLKHKDTPVDIIKMDVEDAEWASLDDMAATNQFRGVKQMFLEFHISKKSSMYLEKLKTLKSLEMAGFKRFYVHKNKHCKIKSLLFPIRRTFCYEVHYIKR